MDALHNITLCFSIKTLSKQVLQTQHTERPQKVSPRGCVPTKREETFPGKFFSTFSGENVATGFPGKVFPTKVYYENISTQTL